jgi:hypothetical protein
MALRLGAYNEHEDASYTRLDGLALAAGNLRAAAAKM